MRNAATRIVPALVLAATLAGCLPVLVGGLIYKSTRTNAEKQEFMAHFRQVNVERQEQGLEPLDWCSEAYLFDKGWAAEDPNCERRIRAYEAGDTDALDIGGRQTTVVVPDTAALR